MLIRSLRRFVSKEFGVAQVIIEKGDLTEQNLDAIVNAANNFLKHGGGLAGSILRKAGQQLQIASDEYVDKNGPIPTGKAVGPVYSGKKAESIQLKHAVLNSLRLAEQLECQSIGIPAISTGIFGYPIEEAAQIHLQAVQEFCKDEVNLLKQIKFVLYDDEAVSFNIQLENFKKFL